MLVGLWVKYLFICMVLFFSSCAVQYVDSNGDRRVLGLANIKIQNESSCNAPQQVEVTTIGVSYIDLPSHGGFSIGYAKNTSLSVKSNTTIVMGENENEKGDK